MTLASWTFEAAEFYPMSGDRTIPRWKREGRVSVENLIGAGFAEFNTFGFNEYRIAIEAEVRDESSYTTLIGLLLETGTLFDGDASYVDVILLKEDLKQTRGGWQGTLEFGRSGG